MNLNLDHHIYYMEKALEEAGKAHELNEVPIGCIIVYKNEIIGKGYNMRNTAKNPLCHAEIIAINNAADYIRDWRLEETIMYVTIEPCAMCAGAILNARIPLLVFGARNSKAGSCGSIVNLLGIDKYNHRCEVIEGVLEEKCSSIMSKFFLNLRNSKKNQTP